MARIDVSFNYSNNETAEATNEINQSSANKTNQNNATNTLLGQAIVSMGKRTLNYGASQYGNMTGNYIMQNTVENAIQGIGYASSILVALKTGGTAGGAVATLAVATEIGLGVVSYSINTNRSNQQANYLMNIRGGILNDKSRV